MAIRFGPIKDERLNARELASTRRLTVAAPRLPAQERCPEQARGAAIPLWGARDGEVESVALWMAQALVDAALREAGDPGCRKRASDQASLSARGIAHDGRGRCVTWPSGQR